MTDKRARRKRRIEKKAAYRGKVHRRSLDLLRKIGIEGPIPPAVADFMDRAPRGSFPVFTFAGDPRFNEALERFKAAIETELAAPTTGPCAPVSPVEFYGTILPFLQGVGNHGDTLLEGEDYRDVGRVLDLVFEHCERGEDEFMKVLAARLQKAAIRASRIDELLYTIELVPSLAFGRPRLELILRATAPEARRFELDARTRPAYRCGSVGSVQKVVWAKVETRAFGIPGLRPSLPAYVQGHVLERLRERIPAPSLEGHTHLWLWESIENAVVTKKQGDRDFLLELRWDGKRLGHLAVTVLDDAVLVRTFLFLTMNGTPENQRLRDELKVGRHELEYFDLDSLSTFILSDLGRDPELRRIFEKCGCGHLFSFVPRENEPELHVADEIKKYFRLDTSKKGR